MLLFALLACGPKNAPPTAVGDATVEPSPALVALIANDFSCEWMAYRPPTFEPELLRTTAVCPEQVLWSFESETTWSSGPEGLMQYRWDGASTMLPRPQAPDSATWVEPWLDGRVLAWGYMFPYEPSCDGGVCAYEVLGRAFQTRVDDAGWEQYYNRGGWPELPSDGEFLGIELPSWGIREVAIALSWDGDAWAVTSGLPTRTSAGDVPGFGVVWPTFPDELDLTTSDLWQRGACGGDPRCSPDGLNATAALEQALPDAEEFGWLAVDGEKFVFGLIWGDSPHIRGPVLRCAGDCTELTPLPIEHVPDTDIGLSAHHDGHALVRSGSSAYVFRVGVAEPVLTLSDVSAAGWMTR